jgi:hypothetical protein
LLDIFTNYSLGSFSLVEKCTKKVYGRARIVTKISGVFGPRIEG